jgi:hypothetical protein
MKRNEKEIIMIKFKEQDGELFRMLDKPVPLTADAELPCLIRPIQDDSPMGRYVKQCWGHDKLFMREYTICGINADMAAKVGFARDTPLSIHMFEIIGTFVKEGSKDWAWYQMMKGEKISAAEMDSQRFYAIKEGCDYCALYENDGSEVRINTRRTYNEFIEYSKMCGISSWEIYKAPKPLLADVKVGDLVKLRNGSYSQIVEVEDGSVFKYQNPEVISSVALFLCDENGDTSRWGKVKDVDIIHTEPLAPEGTAEWALQMMKLGNKVRNRDWDGGIHEKSLLYCQLIGETIKHNEGCSAFDVCLSDWEAPYIKNTGWQLYKEPKPTFKVGDWVEWSEGLGISYQSQITRVSQSAVYSKGICIPLKIITRKLKPSQVVVKIGCLSGTVEKAYGEKKGTFILSGLSGQRNVLWLSMLDTETREIVEGLLKAQEEEK